MTKRSVRDIRVAAFLVAGIAGVLPMASCIAPEDGPRTEMILTLDYSELDDTRLEELKEAGRSVSEIQAQVQFVVMEVVGHRLRGMKIRKPLIEALDSQRIRVQFRSAADPEQVRRLIERTGQLGFHIVASRAETDAVIKDISEAYPDDLKPFLSTDPIPPHDYIVADENLGAVRSAIASACTQGLVPEDKDFLFSGPILDEYRGTHNQMYLLDRGPIQTGDGLTSAEAMSDPHRPQNWVIRFSLHAAAAARFGEVTEANIGRALAIAVDDAVIAAPIIRSRITTNGQIPGAFDEAEARELATALNSGPMPVPVRVVSLVVVNEDAPGKTGPGEQ
jgi:protein-export membrane protein SecD